MFYYFVGFSDSASIPH